MESKNPRRRWSAGVHHEDRIEGRGSGVLRLDRFDAHDDPGVVAQDTLFNAVVVVEITSLDVELGLEAGSAAHHFTGSGETDDRDHRLGHPVHGEITGDIPDRLAETFALGALERHLAELLRIEEVGTLEVLIKLLIATVDAVKVDVDVEGEVILHSRREGHDAVDVVETTPELSGLGMLDSEQGGAVDRIDVVRTGGHVGERFHDRDRTRRDGGRRRHCRGVFAGEEVTGAEIEPSHGGGPGEGDGDAGGADLDGQAEKGHGWFPVRV